MFSNCFNETAYGFQPAFQSRRGPALDKSFSGPRRFIIPETFKLIFQDPYAMDSTIAFAQGLEYAGIIFFTLLILGAPSPDKLCYSCALVHGISGIFQETFPLGLPLSLQRLINLSAAQGAL